MVEKVRDGGRTPDVPFDPSLPTVRKANIIDFIRTSHPHAVIPSKSTLAELREMAKELIASDAVAESSLSELTAQQSEEESQERPSKTTLNLKKQKESPPIATVKPSRKVAMPSPTRGRSMKKRKPTTPSKASKKVAISPSPERGRSLASSTRCPQTPSRKSSQVIQSTSRSQSKSGVVHNRKKEFSSSPTMCSRNKQSPKQRLRTAQKKKVHSINDPLSSPRSSVLRNKKFVKHREKPPKSTKETYSSRKAVSTKKKKAHETFASSVSGSQSSVSSSSRSDQQDDSRSSNESSGTSGHISISSNSKSSVESSVIASTDESTAESDLNLKRNSAFQSKKKSKRHQPQKNTAQSSHKGKNHAHQTRRVTFVKTVKPHIKSAMKIKKESRHHSVKKSKKDGDHHLSHHQPVIRHVSNHLHRSQTRIEDKQLDEVEMGTQHFDTPTLKSDLYGRDPEDYGLDLDTSQSSRSRQRRKSYPYPGGSNRRHPSGDFNESFFTPAALASYSDNPYRPPPQNAAFFNFPMSNAPYPQPIPGSQSHHPQPSSHLFPPSSSNHSFETSSSNHRFQPASTNHSFQPSSSNHSFSPSSSNLHLSPPSCNHPMPPSSSNHPFPGSTSNHNTHRSSASKEPQPTTTYDPYCPILFYDPANPNVPKKPGMSATGATSYPQTNHHSHPSATPWNSQPPVSQYGTTPYCYMPQSQMYTQPPKNPPPPPSSPYSSYLSPHRVPQNPQSLPQPPPSNTMSATTFEHTSQPSNARLPAPTPLYNNPYHQPTTTKVHPPTKAINAAPEYHPPSTSSFLAHSQPHSFSFKFSPATPASNLPSATASTQKPVSDPPSAERLPSIFVTGSSPPSRHDSSLPSKMPRFTKSDQASESPTLEPPTTKTSDRVVRSIKQKTIASDLPLDNLSPALKPTNHAPVVTPKPQTFGPTSSLEMEDIAHAVLAQFLSGANLPKDRFSGVDWQRITRGAFAKLLDESETNLDTQVSQSQNGNASQASQLNEDTVLSTKSPCQPLNPSDETKSTPPLPTSQLSSSQNRNNPPDLQCSEAQNSAKQPSGPQPSALHSPDGQPSSASSSAGQQPSGPQSPTLPSSSDTRPSVGQQPLCPQNSALPPADARPSPVQPSSHPPTSDAQPSALQASEPPLSHCPDSLVLQPPSSSHTSQIAQDLTASQASTQKFQSTKLSHALPQMQLYRGSPPVWPAETGSDSGDEDLV